MSNTEQTQNQNFNLNTIDNELQEKTEDQKQQTKEKHVLQNIQKPINVYRQGCLIYFFFLASYVILATILYMKLSNHWVWALYLFPIFLIVITMILLIFIFIIESYDGNDAKEEMQKTEQCFCQITIMLPIFLIWWPNFLITYLGVYHQSLQLQPDLILHNNQTSFGQLDTIHLINFMDEKYTIITVKISNEQYGYGCISDKHEASVYHMQPFPFQFYELDQSKLPKHISKAVKLPSWFCNGQININYGIVQQDIYSIYLPIDNLLSVNNYTSRNYKPIMFKSQPFIPIYDFALYIAFVYEQLWIFTAAFVFTLVILYDTRKIQKNFLQNQKLQKIQSGELLQPIPSEVLSPLNKINTRKPSRKFRMFHMIFSFLQFLLLVVFMIQLNFRQKPYIIVSLILIILPGFSLLLLSCFSKIHIHFIEAMKLYINFSKQQIKSGLSSKHLHEKICLATYAVIFPIITFLFGIFYILFLLLASLFMVNMKLYLARHFVAFWKQTEEDFLSEKDYNIFVNRIYIFNWLWNGVLSFIFFCVYIGEQTGFIFWICFCVSFIQFSMIFLVFFGQRCRNIFQDTNILWKAKDKKTNKAQILSKQDEVDVMKEDHNLDINHNEIYIQ